MSYPLTCLACCLEFTDSEIQRSHYKTDWHKYNLKRSIVDMVPVSLEEFRKRQEKLSPTSTDTATAKLVCEPCQKVYSSKNAYEAHSRSKKHIKITSHLESFAPKELTRQQKPILGLISENATEKEIKDAIDSNIKSSRILGPKDCLFCPERFDSLDDRLSHLTLTHSFYIPDIEYLIDIEGLLGYLAHKIAVMFTCIHCNGRGRCFYSLEAVWKHMADKGHCKLHMDDELEYSDFYDFTSSYPDFTGDGDIADITSQPLIITPDETALILPSGNRLGSRQYKKYYKQKYKPLEERDSVLINRLIGQYLELGVVPVSKKFSMDQKRARKDDFERRLKIGIVGNNQKHYRDPLLQ